MMIKYTHINSKNPEDVKSMMNEFSQGIRFVLQNRTICKLSYFLLLIYFVIQPIFSVILPMFFKVSLSYSDTQYGYLQTVIIFGALIGSLIVGFLFGKKEKTGNPLIIGFVILVGAMLMFSILLFPTSLYALGNDTLIYFILLAVVLGFFSAGNMFISVPIQTYIQQETPNEYMSRVFSLVSIISRGGIPIGALIYGIILEITEIHLLMLTTTIVMAFTIIISLESLFKTSRNI